VDFANFHSTRKRLQKKISHTSRAGIQQSSHSATHCNTLQHIATHCNIPLEQVFNSLHTLQHAATHSNTLQHIATYLSNSYSTVAPGSNPRASNLTATHCNTLQHTATYCNKLQHTTTHCTTLHHTAPHYTTLHHTTLHHTPTHCNTPFEQVFNSGIRRQT